MFSGIPLPRTVSDTEKGGGFVTSLSGQNALTAQNMQNRLTQAQGNLAQQQANFTPYQYATQALSNPNIWLTDEGRKSAGNIISQLPALAQQGIGKQNNSLSQLDSPGLMQMIMQKLTGGAQGGWNSSLGQNSLAQNGPANQNPLSPSQGIPNGSPYGTAASEVAQQSNPGMNVTPTPVDTQKALAAAQQAGVVGQTNNQTAEQKASNENINSQSSGAVNVLKALEGWKHAYDKSTYKGQYAGSFPSSGKGSIPTLLGSNSSPEQLADNFKNEVVQASEQMQANGGHLTDDARDLLVSSKGIDRSLDKEAAEVTYESKKSTLERMIQSRQFADNFFKNNPQATQEQLTAMMNNYNRFAPAYDYKNFKPLPENAKKFKEFSSKEALDSYIQNGEYIPKIHAKEEKINEEPAKNKANEAPKKVIVAGGKQKVTASKLLGNNAKFPEFDSKEDFDEWKSRQDPLVLDAYQKHLGLK